MSGVPEWRSLPFAITSFLLAASGEVLTVVSPCAMNQEGAEIDVALFGKASQHGLLPRRVLLGDESQPSCELSPVLKGRPRTAGGYKRSGGDGPYTLDLHQPARRFVLFG